MTTKISLEQSIRSVFGADEPMMTEDANAGVLDEWQSQDGLLYLIHDVAEQSARVEISVDYVGVAAFSFGEAIEVLTLARDYAQFIEKRGYKATTYRDSARSGVQFDDIPIKTQTDLDGLCTIVKEARDSLT